MRKQINLIIIIGIFLVIFGHFATATSSTTWVNFTVHPYNNSLNNTFNGKVSELKVEEKSKNNIVWEWRNSPDSLFSYNLVFLDNILVANGTLGHFNAVGLKSGKCYIISIVSISNKGVEGPLVVRNGCTVQERSRKRIIHRNGAITTREPTPDSFFREGEAIAPENMTIVLNESPSKKSIPNEFLVLWILALSIFVLIILIIINFYTHRFS